MKALTLHGTTPGLALGLARGLALALALAAVGAQGANTVTIDGSGAIKANVDTREATNSVIDLYQVSSGRAGQENQAGTAASPITQSGSGHLARIGQGASWDGIAWVPGTAVDKNTALIRQSGTSGDKALIVQTSSNNTATIIQGGSLATASIIQGGSGGNTATINQGGLSATASITQNSGNNTATIIQGGPLAMAAITQGGSGGHTASIETLSTYIGAGVIVNQTGANNSADVKGMTGGSANIDQSGTGGSVSLVNQASGTLNISQQGTNNHLIVENYGVGASAGKTLTITQTGEGGAATIFNPSPAPEGPTYVY